MACRVGCPRVGGTLRARSTGHASRGNPPPAERPAHLGQAIRRPRSGRPTPGRRSAACGAAGPPRAGDPPPAERPAHLGQAIRRPRSGRPTSGRQSAARGAAGSPRAGDPPPAERPAHLGRCFQERERRTASNTVKLPCLGTTGAARARHHARVTSAGRRRGPGWPAGVAAVSRRRNPCSGRIRRSKSPPAWPSWARCARRSS